MPEPSIGPDAADLRRAVRELRDRRAYPVTLAALTRHLRLSAGRRRALSEKLEREGPPSGLASIPGGGSRSARLVLEGEEDFGRPLRRAEQIDLRIRLADLEAAAGPERGAPFADAFDAAFDRLSRETTSPFVRVPELRRALTAWSESDFDREVVALCAADRYQLSEHEHAARLPAGERLGALAWGGRSYFFVSRV
jgi:hypothetical protein